MTGLLRSKNLHTGLTKLSWLSGPDIGPQSLESVGVSLPRSFGEDIGNQLKLLNYRSVDFVGAFR